MKHTDKPVRGQVNSSAIKDLQSALSFFKNIKFTHYDKITLTAERNKIKWHPELYCKIKPHPKSKWAIVRLNNHNVPIIEYHNSITETEISAYRKKGIQVYPMRRYQRIRGGTIEFEGGGVRLNILQDKQQPRRQSADEIRHKVKEAIQHVIDSGFIIAENNDAAVESILSKFNFAEVELNTFFSDLDMYNLIKDCYGNLNGFETVVCLDNFGCRIRDEEMRLRAVHVHRKLNRPESSCYLWQNSSSKLYVYNVTAKKEKRSSNKPSDSIKVELTLRRQFFKNNKIKQDFDLRRNIAEYGLYQKVCNALSAPFRVALTRHVISQKLNEKRGAA